MDIERLLTIRQVQDRLQISDEGVYRLIRSGKLRAIRVGHLWRVSHVALDEFLKRGGDRKEEEQK